MNSQDDPVSKHGGEVDGKYNENNKDSDIQEEEEEKNYLLPSRWWFASTAFPLIAGTFGPMASAFSVCALVQYWRVSIPPGGTEEHGARIQDPGWLLAINAVSLIFALIANMSLLLNMARRLRFNWAQPITIIGFYVACFLLVGLISVFGGGYMQAPGVADQALSQAYYYAIFAAGLYFIIATLMLGTVYGAWKGHYESQFKLTISQRTLMLQTMAYMVYLLIGALIFSVIEGWMFLDAVYFANFTLLTVGIGDYSPATHAGRSFLFPYAIGGIVILGLVVGSIRSLVLDRGKKKLSARNFEKTRKAVLKRLAQDDHKRPHRGQLVAQQVAHHAPELSLNPDDDKESELKRREAEFEVMRDIQRVSEMERKWISLLVSGTSWFVLWFIGAIIFEVAERNQNWTYFEALYFSYTSLLTIGYGDLYPMSNSGKPFFVFWSLLAVPALTILISNMGDTIVKGIKDLTLILGEITVLPGEKGSTRDRIKVAISKVTGGRFTVGKGGQELGKHIDEREGQMDREDEGVKERVPGMPYEPKQKHEGMNGDEEKGHNHHHHKGNNKKEDAAMLQRLGADMEANEHVEEEDAHDRGDQLEEDEHHYRYLLIREIRSVYNHIGSQPPRKYTYSEWRHYLKLLGQDESSSKFHRRAPRTLPGQSKGGQPEIENNMPSSALADNPDEDGREDGPIRHWSWIGIRSPLMGDEEEAEWVLNRLVAQLENELKKASTESRTERRREMKGKRDDGTLRDDGVGQQDFGNKTNVATTDGEQDPEKRDSGSTM